MESGPAKLPPGRKQRSHLVDALAAVLLRGLGILGWECYEDALEATGCRSEGLSHVRLALESYAATHAGTLPTEADLAAHVRGVIPPRSGIGRVLGGHLPRQCNKGRYQWAAVAGQVADAPTRPLVWCHAPHGLVRQWRNVIFDDLSRRRVPEREFRAMSKGRLLRPLQSYRPLDPQ